MTSPTTKRRPVLRSIAAKILAREVRPQDHQRLVEESLHELQAAGAV